VITTKKSRCNSLLKLNGTYPYYYINNNNTYIIYLTQISIDIDNDIQKENDNDEDRGIIIDLDNPLNSRIYNYKFQNKIYRCGDNISYENNIISYYDEYKIEIPINDSIVLKSVMDVDEIDQTQEMICSIYDKTVKKAKPMQVLSKIFKYIISVLYF